MQFHTTGIVLAALTVASAASAQTTRAVEWKVSEGGNGHWYQVVFLPTANWETCRIAAHQIGGELAVVPSADEWSYVSGVIDGAPTNLHVWLGAERIPSEGWVWRWVDGNDLSYAPWISCAPNNPLVGHIGLANGRDCGTMHGWDDFTDDSWEMADFAGFVVEWSADCNADGIVDYGQIRRRELADDNHNNIPDVCETSVTGVLPPSVPSQGGVTITINGRNFPDNPTVLVGGTHATDVVRVSATRLTATTPAGLPGMTSISVNGFTLPDAFYYRPECGSDLDQNGTVDAGDISIILLDFGPCYEPPTALATPAPTPLLAPDESTPAPTPPAPQSARPTPQPRGIAS
jgi:hypothetical protein